jgi:hypothetical protein
MAALVLSGDTSGTVSLGAPLVAGTQAYTLPTALPAVNGYALVSTTAGTMSWAAAAGGGGGIILESQIVISQNYSLSSNTNGFSVGPVSVATGFAVTVGTGQTWLVSQ